MIEIEIIVGTDVGRTIQVAGQPVVFGRTVTADIVIADDRLVSSRHFQVHIEDGVPTLLDLGSTNGTTLNGERVTAARLGKGDLVVAGNTSFLIKAVPQAESGSPLADENPSSHSFNPFDSYHGPKGKQPTGTVEAASPKPQGIEAVVSHCADGLIKLKGKLSDETQAVKLAKKLNKLGSLYLIADFSRFDADLPESFDIDDSKIFDRLPAVAAVKTPLLLDLKECEAWESYIEESWGFDAMVILQSSLQKSDLLTALRELLFTGENPEQAGQSINGFCWPTVLASVIENDPEQLGKAFMQHVDIAMLETPGDAQSWQLYATEDVLKQLVELGFRATEESSQPIEEAVVE